MVGESLLSQCIWSMCDKMMWGFIVCLNIRRQFWTLSRTESAWSLYSQSSLLWWVSSKYTLIFVAANLLDFLPIQYKTRNQPIDVDLHHVQRVTEVSMIYKNYFKRVGGVIGYLVNCPIYSSSYNPYPLPFVWIIELSVEYTIYCLMK